MNLIKYWTSSELSNFVHDQNNNSKLLKNSKTELDKNLITHVLDYKKFPEKRYKNKLKIKFSYLFIFLEYL